jgi:hypothetical protein
MGKGGGVDALRLERAAARLGDTVLDPAIWPEVLQEICRSLDSCSAVLLQPDLDASARAVRQHAPFTDGFGPIVERYYRDGWYLHDARAPGIMALMSRGRMIISDRDLIRESYLTEEMQRHNSYLNEF